MEISRNENGSFFAVSYAMEAELFRNDRLAY